MPEPTDDPFAPLAKFGFDSQLFAQWQLAVADGKLSKANNLVTDELLAPPKNSVKQLPSRDSKDWESLAELGAGALKRGELGIVILNGGMATRFGGVVKGAIAAATCVRVNQPRCLFGSQTLSASSRERLLGRDNSA